MKALVAAEAGRGLDGVGLVEIDCPQPGPEDVLIRVAAVSASRLDLSVLNGSIGGVRTPRVLGIDPVGVVVDAGDRVDRALVGTTVVVKPNLFCGACEYCKAGREADCLAQPILGVHLDGGAAELVAVPARCTFPVPDGITPVSAAATVHTIPVALHMLRLVADRRDDLAGRTVLVTGAAGAVGSAVVQLARAFGATVIGAVRGSARAAAVSAAGARHVVDPSGVDPGATLRVVAPDGVDVVVETTGDGLLAAWSIDQLAWTGRWVTCTGNGVTLPIDLGGFYRGRRTLYGTAGSDAVDVTDGLAMVAAGVVRPVIDRVLPLADFRLAYEAFGEPGGRTGRIVFRVPD